MTVLTLTDLFCGAGGSTQGAVSIRHRGEQLLTARIAANHWQRAIDTHQENFPETEHDCADISQVDFRRYPATDLLWASPECFPAGTLITLDRGQVPIEEVQVGELALTHLGRWRPVVRTQHRAADTVVVRGQGHPGLEVTPNHRLWARHSGMVWKGRREQYKREYADPAWTHVDELLVNGAMWGTPISFEPLPVSDPPAVFGLDLTAAWWLVGRWVGDGSLGIEDHTDTVITCGYHEATALAERLSDTGTAWTRHDKRTAVTFVIYNAKARDWLRAHFGHGAARKGLPSFVYAMPHAHRRALLDGYLSADGGFTQRRVRASTVSRRLGVGVRLLAETLGHRVSAATDHRTSYEIEGRVGPARPQWINHWEPTLSARRAPEAWTDDLHAWSRVRVVEPGRTGVTVHNLEVADDHSYIADGIVASNCTNHSQAKGRKRGLRGQGDLFGDDEDPAAVRSRATMWDVPRALEAGRMRGRPYKGFVIENVVEAREWEYWRAWWVAVTDCAGYCVHVVSLNSMHAQGAGLPAPQSRDRLYVVGHLQGIRCPDLPKWTSPTAWCGRCASLVRARQAWKNGRAVGRYRQQYVYVCPTSGCGRPVEPAYLPAAAAIDWSNLGQRIGDRLVPLAEKTVARIAAGLAKYARPITLEAAGHTFERRPGVRTWPVDAPLTVLSTTASKAVALAPGMLVPAGGTWNDAAMSTEEPMRARTTRDAEALVVPVEGRDGIAARTAGEPLRSQTTRLQDALVVPFLVANRGGADAHRSTSVEQVMPTLVASPNPVGLVQPFIAELRGGSSDARPVTEPLATVVASGNHHGLTVPPHQSLVTWPADQLIYTYDGGAVRPVTDPLPTQTAVDGDALLRVAAVVDDCLFRMLEPPEIGAGMAFDASYIVLGTKRERVRQYGNAVTPPAARDLLAALAEVILGEDLDLERAS